MRLAIASNNMKKRQEIMTILGDLGIELVAPEDTIHVDVVEDAFTFAGNARKKAEAFAKANHCPALADDSGLCVEALDGAPGIHSARFASADANNTKANNTKANRADDVDNNRKLLADLSGHSNRAAFFICSLHLAYPDSDTSCTAEGVVNGEIVHQPSGTGGFGYDPVFFCPELGKIFAEASVDEKASVSHRGRALRILAEQLKAGV